MNLVDITDTLALPAKEYFKTLNSRLVEISLNNIDKKTLIHLFENMQWADLNSKHICLKGDFLYFRPSSWGHSKHDNELIFNREKYIHEPAMICDNLKRSYFPCYVDDDLLSAVNRLSLSSQFFKEKGREIKYQVLPNEGFRIVDPVFVFDKIIKDRQDFPSLIEFKDLGLIKGTYVPEVGFPSYLN